MKNEDIWYNEFITLYKRYCREDTSHLAHGKYFIKEYYKKGITPSQVVLDMLKDDLEELTDKIKSLDKTFITDTDRLDHIFEEWFQYKPAHYDGRPVGRWDCVFDTEDQDYRRTIDECIEKSRLYDE